MSFLLLETGDRLLQEIGDFILLDGVVDVFDGPALVINGEDVTPLIRLGDIFQNPTFTWRRNQRSLLTFDIEGSYPKRAEVLWYAKDGSVPILGGYIERREPVEVPVDEDVPFCSRVEVVDFSRAYDWSYWIKSYTSDVTRKQILTDLVTEKLFPNAGITLDPAQADGPTYTATVEAPLVFGTAASPMLVAEVMKFLVGADAIDRISPLKVLKVFNIGSEAAPVSFTTANRKASRLTWADSTQTPANTLIGLFGPSGTLMTRQLWIADGVATSWVTDIPAAAAPALVLVDDGVTPALKTVGNGADFEWNTGTSTLSVGTYGTPAAGVRLVLGPSTAAGDPLETDGYLGQYPFKITKTTGATPVVEKLVNFPKITNYAQADIEAQRAHDQFNQDDARVFSIDTLEDGIFPGHALPIDVPEREADDVEAIVTAVQGVANTDLFWEYTVTAEEAELLQIDTIADLRQQLVRAA